MSIDIQAVLTVMMIIASSSVVTGVVVALFSKKKVAAETDDKRADAIKKIEEATSSLLSHYVRDNEAIRREYENLKEAMDECLLEIQDMKRKLTAFEEKYTRSVQAIEKLVHQIRSYGQVPVCQPKDWNGN